MLYLSNKLYDNALLSLRSAGRIGKIIGPIINPHNLHVDGFWCNLPGNKTNLILLDIDIRDLSPKGIIIDDNLHLSEPDDLIRLKPVLEIDYKILEKPVIANNKKIGKLAEYAIDRESMFIQKLYVQPPLWQAVNQHRLIFDRSSVVEVTDSHIIVSGPEEKQSETENVKRSFTATYPANTSFIKE
jgi:sporulation protein YlmC with PRC-barrel domain